MGPEPLRPVVDCGASIEGIDSVDVAGTVRREACEVELGCFQTGKGLPNQHLCSAAVLDTGIGIVATWLAGTVIGRHDVIIFQHSLGNVIEIVVNGTFIPEFVIVYSVAEGVDR